MRILYVVHATSWEDPSGTPLIAKQYAKKVIKKGYEAAIITPTFEDIDFNNQLSKDVNNIKYFKWPGLTNWSLEAFSFDDFKKDTEFLIPYTPDLVHIVDWINFNPNILKALKKLNVPVVKHVLNIEDLCYFTVPIYKNKDHSPCLSPLTSTTCAECITSNKIKNEKFLKKIKRIILNEKPRMIKMTENKLNNRNEIVAKQIEEYFDHLLFPSRSLAKYYFTHLKTDKPYSIKSLGLEKIELIKKQERTEKLKCIYIGGANLQKGWDVIEEVFDKLLKEYQNKIELRIYGHKKKTERSSLSKYSSVKFFESFNPNQIAELFSWADIGLAPTYFEGYSRTIREYMMYGAVPISTEAFGIPDVITSNENGIIIKKPYVQGLYAALKKILREPKFLDEMKLKAKNTPITSVDEEFNEIFKIYKSLTKKIC